MSELIEEKLGYFLSTLENFEETYSEGLQWDRDYFEAFQTLLGELEHNTVTFIKTFDLKYWKFAERNFGELDLFFQKIGVEAYRRALDNLHDEFNDLVESLLCRNPAKFKKYLR